VTRTYSGPTNGSTCWHALLVGREGTASRAAIAFCPKGVRLNDGAASPTKHWRLFRYGGAGRGE